MLTIPATRLDIHKVEYKYIHIRRVDEISPKIESNENANHFTCNLGSLDCSIRFSIRLQEVTYTSYSTKSDEISLLYNEHCLRL